MPPTGEVLGGILGDRRGLRRRAAATRSASAADAQRGSPAFEGSDEPMLEYLLGRRADDPARGQSSSLAASPVLVGAVTLLVSIVAVFLSYNANSGLPFVPTYDVRIQLPNAANLVRGNEVRIGGARVGVIEKIDAVQRGDEVNAVVDAKLDADLEPLPIDSTFIVRPRSALGLKYIELTPGDQQGRLRRRATTIPLSQATPDPVEIDEVFNIFDAPTRRGSQQSLDGFGSGFAGRGRSLNEAIAELRPLLRDLEPVAANLADPRDPARALLQGPRRRGRRGGAGGRGAGRAVREHGHHVHRARRRGAAVHPGVHLREPADARHGGRRVPEASARSCATAPASSAS